MPLQCVNAQLSASAIPRRPKRMEVPSVPTFSKHYHEQPSPRLLQDMLIRGRAAHDRKEASLVPPPNKAPRQVFPPTRGPEPLTRTRKSFTKAATGAYLESRTPKGPRRAISAAISSSIPRPCTSSGRHTTTSNLTTVSKVMTKSTTPHSGRQHGSPPCAYERTKLYHEASTRTKQIPQKTKAIPFSSVPNSPVNEDQIAIEALEELEDAEHIVDDLESVDDDRLRAQMIEYAQRAVDRANVTINQHNTSLTEPATSLLHARSSSFNTGSVHVSSATYQTSLFVNPDSPLTPSITPRRSSIDAFTIKLKEMAENQKASVARAVERKVYWEEAQKKLEDYHESEKDVVERWTKARKQGWADMNLVMKPEEWKEVRM